MNRLGLYNKHSVPLRIDSDPTGLTIVITGFNTHTHTHTHTHTDLTVLNIVITGFNKYSIFHCEIWLQDFSLWISNSNWVCVCVCVCVCVYTHTSFSLDANEGEGYCPQRDDWLMPSDRERWLVNAFWQREMIGSCPHTISMNGGVLICIFTYN